MPSNLSFGPRGPRYSQSSVLGMFHTGSAHSWPFVAIFGLFLGHIMESEVNNGLLVTEQSMRTWSVTTVSLRLAVLGFSGPL